jgi:hypothetical protein
MVQCMCLLCTGMLTKASINSHLLPVKRAYVVHDVVNQVGQVHDRAAPRQECTQVNETGLCKVPVSIGLQTGPSCNGTDAFP